MDHVDQIQGPKAHGSHRVVLRTDRASALLLRCLPVSAQDLVIFPSLSRPSDNIVKEASNTSIMAIEQHIDGLLRHVGLRVGKCDPNDGFVRLFG